MPLVGFGGREGGKLWPPSVLSWRSLRCLFWRLCGPETFGFRPRESLVRTVGSQAETRAVGDLHWKGFAPSSQLLESFCVINLKNSIVKAWDSIKLAYKNKNMVMVKMR